MASCTDETLHLPERLFHMHHNLLQNFTEDDSFDSSIREQSLSFGELPQS